MRATSLNKDYVNENLSENSLYIVKEKSTNIIELNYLKKRPVYSAVKRAFDLVLSFFALVVSAIPMFIIAILIRCDSNGPVIYSQERLGRKGKPFTLFKFRSMRADAEIVSGPKWADACDDRVTRVGRFLRKTRLDELPQFLNIFLGQMSFIGPRPEREYFYCEFEKDIPGFRQRLMVKPGLSGLAQINGGYDLSPQEKLVYDCEYIKTRSLMMDFKLMFKTVKVIFTHDGAR